MVLTERAVTAEKWTRSSTLRLLEEVKARYNDLGDRPKKNTVTQKEVAGALQDHLPRVKEAQCNQKWHNLKQQYIDNQGKTGRGKMARTEFFHKIEEIVGSDIW